MRRATRSICVAGFSALCVWARGGWTPVAVDSRRVLSRSLARFWRLSRISAQQTVFERGAIKPADNGVHFLLVWRFDKSESLRFLRFRVADDLDIVRN